MPGDMTYEGTRSINGPYLATLGAGTAVVGIASGFGEFIGFAIRLGSLQAAALPVFLRLARAP